MGRGGFKYSPAHHYNYPFWQKQRSFKHWDNKNCTNGKFDYTIYIHQIKSFIDRMNLQENQKKSYVSVNILKGTTHDYFEFPRGFDRELKSYLEQSDKKGLFKNTALLIFSDHGGRAYNDGEKNFDDFGRLEYPFPFLSIRLPRSMRNSEFSKNFFKNKNKILTSIDFRKTLKHLYYIAKNGINQNEKNTQCRKIFNKSQFNISSLRGYSLFEDLPEKRTLLDSFIPLSFYPCKIRNRIDENNFFNKTGLPISSATNFFMVNLIEKTNHIRSICEEFKFKKLLEISQILDLNIFELKVSTIPANAVFKIMLNVDKKVFRAVYGMTRENKYGDQSNCLQSINNHLKGFCYCKN